MSVRTRIAPSPTGYMHIGTLRMVMFDYFLARQAGGQFIVRIEDTDQSRLVPGALEGLLNDFQKLGIDYDEGPILDNGQIKHKGNHGPYIQSERLELYRPYVDQLIKAGHAYACFCSKERLDQMRETQMAAKQTPKYDRRCLNLTTEDIAEKLGQGEAHVIRLKIPAGKVSFVDAIRGKIEFDLNDVDDQVLIKSDGFPTYHMALVVDDHLMQITHVLRGEEWISSTPKHIVLHQMLGWDMPVYAHAPLILNPDKTKLSKRKGDVSVSGYLAKGYLPAALINFISTLGFNPKADQEIYDLQELVKLFDLSKVNKGGAVMNTEKLDWMNHYYLQQLSEKDLFLNARPFLGDAVNTADQELIHRALWVERQRVKRLDEFTQCIQSYLELPAYSKEILIWKKSDLTQTQANLEKVLELIQGLADDKFSRPELLEELLKEYIASNQLETGKVLWPLRVALSGAEKSAGPFEYLWVLGKTEATKRLQLAIKHLS